ncbi:MAG: hypothetical protein JNM66_26810 [Bryobacterales bacterium]|nr:hypothetical protein [Bryobacterales bacterium]
MAGSLTMIAHQVAAKAARDGLFLQQFEPADLPKMVVAAAILSFALAALFARASERFGPARLVPSAFALSAILHLLEWFLMPQTPRAVVVLVYLHVVGLGAILLSGFWLLLSESFDLREAKKRFGRIAGVGTVGGILGGVLAERLVAWSWGDHLLLLLGAFHVACAALAARLRPVALRPHRAQPPVSVTAAFRRTPLLWQLAALVFLGTCTAALLDYLFKLGASMALGKGPELVRYFAFYYTGCQVLTFLLQTFLAKSAVQRLGVAKSVASLPVAVGIGSTVALLVPVYPLVVALRALEMILRGSLFRSGYEFLYTPVPPSDKRAVKSIVDVGFDRVGDAVGAGAVQLMMWLGPTLARPEILGLAMVLTALSTALALRLDSSYRGVLERGLVERAREDDDGASLNTAFEGFPSLPAMPAVPHAAEQSVPVPAAPTPALADPALDLLHDLRSRDASRVRRALAITPWEPLAIPQVIRLLAWQDVTTPARAYLQLAGPRILGQLNDALADPDLDYGIRRRLPRLLAQIGEQPGIDGLVRALDDPRFEIRYQCGRALDYLRRHHPQLDYHPAAVMAAAGRELLVNQSIWNSRRPAEPVDGSSDSYDFLDELLRDRSSRSLEHVFSLFAVVLPREPLMAAFRALHQDDKAFRGLALEYLETMLPDEIRQRLWIVVHESPPVVAPADRQRLLDTLLETNASLLLRARLEAHSPVLPPQPGSDPQPHQSHPGVEPRESGEPHR